MIRSNTARLETFARLIALGYPMGNNRQPLSSRAPDLRATGPQANVPAR
jgi:hypothetical protein